MIISRFFSNTGELNLFDLEFPCLEVVTNGTRLSVDPLQLIIKERHHRRRGCRFFGEHWEALPLRFSETFHQLTEKSEKLFYLKQSFDSD